MSKTHQYAMATESELRTALMFTPVAIGVTNEAGDILMLNEAFLNTFGYAASELTNVEVWMALAYPDPLYRAEVVSIWDADLEISVKTGRPTPSREYFVTNRQGEVRRVAIMMRKVDDLFFSTFEDVTKARETEEELANYRAHLEELVARRTQDLAHKNEQLSATLTRLQQTQERLVQESKMAGLGKMVAVIAHELNTPIGNARVVSTSLGHQARAFAEKVAAGALRKSDFNEFLGQISEGSELLDRNLSNATELIQSFKEVALDRTSFQRQAFDFRQVVDDAVSTLVAAMQRTQFTVTSEVAADIALDGYPGQLGQILFNLIENAFLHGFQGREEGVIAISGNRVGDSAILTVADNGCGILEEHVPLVFDPFFTTRLAQGSHGLGLSVVFNIVTGPLGGSIELVSRPGEGTVIKIVFPLVAPSAHAASPLPAT